MPGGRHEGQSRTSLLEPKRLLQEPRQPPGASLGELIILVLPAKPRSDRCFGATSSTLVSGSPPSAQSSHLHLTLWGRESSCPAATDREGGAGASSWGRAGPGQVQGAGRASVPGAGKWHQGTLARV